MPVRYLVLGLFAVLAAITYLDRACIAQAMVLMARDLSLDPASRGLVFSAFTLGYALFEIPAGWLGDRLGPRGVLLRVVLWWSCFTALTGAAWSLLPLLAIRFAFGAGEAGAFPNMARALTQWFPSDQRGRIQAVIWTSTRLGGAIAPRLTERLMTLVGWRFTFLVFGAFGVFWVIPFWLWYRDDPDSHPAVSPEERAWIRSRRRVVERTALDEVQPTPWGRIVRNPSVWGLCLATFWSAFGWYFFITWLPEYLQVERGLSSESASWLAGLPMLFGVFGCLIGGVVSDELVRIMGSTRWARRIVGCAGQVTAGAFFLMSIGIVDARMTVLFMAITHFCNDLPLSSLWAANMDVGERHAGVISGIVSAASALGALLSPLVFGGILRLGLGWTPALMTAGIGFVFSGLSWLLVDPTRTVSPPDRVETGPTDPDVR